MIAGQRMIFERILCPTDLSPESDEALRYAVAIARSYGAKLYVCNCLEGAAIAGVGPHDVRGMLTSTVARYLARADARSLDWEPVIVEGTSVEGITSVAAERRVDLIVMRSRRRPLTATLLGSTAESLCRLAPCPVLVTHPRQREWAAETTSEIDLRRVLVAYDFSSDSELALAYGLSLAQEYQAELHLLHVLQSKSRSEAPENAFLPFAGADFDRSARRLHTAVPEEARLWCEIKHAVREGQPYREILAYAEEQQVDLICIGASGKDFGMKALFGSNADRVLRQANCPVLIARPLRPASGPPA